MTITYKETLGKHDITLPDDLIADLEVPILSGAQCQGDVGIFPRPHAGKAELAHMVPVPTAGIPIVRGQNTHILDAYQGDVFWQADGSSLLSVGILYVPEGSVGMITHTDEHTTNGVGPGTYRVTGKREQSAEIRRVAD